MDYKIKLSRDSHNKILQSRNKIWYRPTEQIKALYRKYKIQNHYSCIEDRILFDFVMDLELPELANNPYVQKAQLNGCDQISLVVTLGTLSSISFYIGNSAEAHIRLKVETEKR